MTPEELLALDKQLLWHPYSSANSSLPIFPVKRAQGVNIELSDGTTLIDGMSSWWSVIHGYNHPELNRAIQEQLEDMAHVMFGGLTHEPAVALAKRLVDITPKELNKVFICDSGSVAVEVAMKMAIQYWQSQNQNSKHRFLSLRNGYHGDTFAAMSVCDPITGMHHLFSQVLNTQVFTDSPQCGFYQDWEEYYIEDFKNKIEKNHSTLAAVILEPIVQGTGGMRMYSPEFLKRARLLCDEYNVLLIADEIATGFGRTGKLFACEYADVTPDILCLGKAMTGGYMSLAATLCTNHIAELVCSGESRVFMHGPTFMANPLACAVANKSIELLVESQWQVNILRIQEFFKDHLKAFQDLPAVESVRSLGAIGVIELKQPADLHELPKQFVNKGIWLRPFGKLVYTMPPYIIQNSQLESLVNATYAVLKDIK